MARKTYNFGAEVQAFADATTQDLEAILKESTLKAVAKAQTTVGNGGPMPVDTGFLRGSCTIGRNTEPADVTTIRSGTAWVADLTPVQLGDTLKVRWTADYAPYVEYGAQGRTPRGFKRQAELHWPQAVRNAASKVFN